ncbi:aldehyde dehydrogenase family protein [Streptomyces vinaceus]|uniref:hypothetical protein n=1 Tax=Streptomyces vinaceus TaxID=1960 RepID=UPI0036D1F8E0
MCDAQEPERVRKVLWPDGKRLDRHLVGRTAAEIAMEAGIITRLERTMAVAARVDTCRVVVNQSTMTNTGGFSTGVPFTTVLAGGSWGGCGMSGNITWSHLLNYTTVSRPIPERRPDPARCSADTGIQPSAVTSPEGARRRCPMDCPLVMDHRGAPA